MVPSAGRVTERKSTILGTHKLLLVIAMTKDLFEGDLHTPYFIALIYQGGRWSGISYYQEIEGAGEEGGNCQRN